MLPESGTNIKGQIRSVGELQEASGYATRPKDFADLIHILDGELRLITPTELEVYGDDQMTDSVDAEFAGSRGGRGWQTQTRLPY